MLKALSRQAAPAYDRLVALILDVLHAQEIPLRPPASLAICLTPKNVVAERQR